MSDSQDSVYIVACVVDFDGHLYAYVFEGERGFIDLVQDVVKSPLSNEAQSVLVDIAYQGVWE